MIKNMIRKTISLVAVFALLCIFFFPVAVNAVDENEIDMIGFDIDKRAGAVYLYSYEGDRVMLCRNGEDTIAPAATAKMMAGLVVCENYATRLEEDVTVTEDMISDIEGTSMGLKAGMVVTLKDLLLGTVCGGNNDAAQAMAIACTGSVKKFVEEMNILADCLYMKNTVYKNPTGLDSKGAGTTLSDTARLARRAAENELYVSVSSLPSFELVPKVGESKTVYNRNALASQFSATGYTNKYAKGLISGNTDEGGYVLASYACKDNTSYLCVVMGAQAYDGNIYSYSTANKLFTHVFGNYSLKKIANAGDSLITQEVDLSVFNGKKVNLECVLTDDVFAFVSDELNVKNDITYKTYLHVKDLKAPISAGDAVGGVDFYDNGILIASAKLVAKDDIEANAILYSLDRIKNIMFSRFFLIGVIISCMTVSVFLYTIGKYERHKRVGTVRFNKFS